MSLMIRARLLALRHIRVIFPRKGCRIWRLYTHLGFRTRWVGCQCGQDFGGSRPVFFDDLMKVRPS